MDDKPTSNIIVSRLAELGESLPPALMTPDGVKLPFAPVHVVGKRVLVSGHGPQDEDGNLMSCVARVGGGMSEEAGYAAARRATLSMLASLQSELETLDRVKRWVRVFGMVRSQPRFHKQPNVINGCSDLLLALWGPEFGQHSRSAVGMFELPFGIAVEIEAEAELC